MRFDLFQNRTDAHIKKAQEYLQAAHIARLEHHVAAEHHFALATMYEQRISWLEQGLSASVVRFSVPLRGVPATSADSAKRVADSLMTLLRTQQPDCK